MLLVGFLSKWNEDKKTELLFMALFLIGVIWTFQVFYLVNRPVKFKIQAVSFLLMTFFSSLFYILFGIKEAFWLEIALLQNISQFSLSSKKMEDVVFTVGYAIVAINLLSISHDFVYACCIGIEHTPEDDSLLEFFLWAIKKLST
jgi:hypothetical protein